MTREPPIPETMTLHVPFRIVKRKRPASPLCRVC